MRYFLDPNNKITHIIYEEQEHNIQPHWIELSYDEYIKLNTDEIEDTDIEQAKKNAIAHVSLEIKRVIQNISQNKWYVDTIYNDAKSYQDSGYSGNPSQIIEHLALMHDISNEVACNGIINEISKCNSACFEIMKIDLRKREFESINDVQFIYQLRDQLLSDLNQVVTFPNFLEI